ncbi:MULTISPECIES: RidA family protein [unclassified Mesorhizobium]|uniref:RidA family protein n=1 Tax=unclassified Mesorhizobium TaxID=325217 RepID=UPI001FEFCDAF|nr:MULTISPECIES: RidA family protein [unclassified Mesorhizobium]
MAPITRLHSDPRPDDQLRLLGIALPPPRRPVANFVPAIRHGQLLYLSGQGPVDGQGTARRGTVGRDVTGEEAYQHARQTAINLLSVAKEALGSLDCIERVIKVLGFVNAVPGFEDHPRVINGCSDLLLDVFGPIRGAHARSAIGAGSLPRQITVEIEMIIAVKEAG